MSVQRRVCPACRQEMPPTAQQCLLCGHKGQGTTVQRPGANAGPSESPPPPPPPPKPQPTVLMASDTVIITDDGQVHVRVTDAKEAAAAIKQLRVYKREWTIRKREVTHEARQIRSDYQHRIATRCPTIRGRGTVLGIVRTLQVVSHDAERRQKAEALRPLEERKFAIERIIAEIDRLILQLERYRLQN